MASSVTEMALSVWWSRQLADEVLRGFGSLSRAVSAEVLLLNITSIGITRFRCSKFSSEGFLLLRRVHHLWVS